VLPWCGRWVDWSRVTAPYHLQTIQRFVGVDDAAHLEEQALRFDRITSLLGRLGARGPMLELGALGGAFAERYSQALGLDRRDVTCCDYVPELLDQAAARGFEVCLWNVESEPPPPVLGRGRYGTVLFCEIIEHLVDPGATLERVMPLLAPGGLFLMTTPNLASLGNRLRLLLGRSPSLAPAPSLRFRAAGSLAAFDHLRVCVSREWSELLAAHGLRVELVTGCTYGPRRPETLRRWLTLNLHRVLEDLPGGLFMGTLIAARKV
jgi:2-polyprenyl-3-methyl-5-hydroxy-6-metoxy-1,4-benzoquinol methylase